MIPLAIPISMLQGAILAAVLIMICLFIHWLDRRTDNFCRRILNLEIIFNIGILRCKSCIRSFLRLIMMMGERQNLGFLIAVTAATCYAGSTYMALHNDLDCLQGVVAGWFLSIAAVVVAYDWNNPPSVLISRVVISLGILCLLLGVIALHFKYYHCLFMMGLVGAYTILLGVFLKMMNYLKSTEEDFDDNDD